MTSISQTTGQVSGLLNIKVQALQRYVREYRVYFSDLAARSDRGRRWTKEDIQAVVTIRGMKQKHKSHEEITAALADPGRVVVPDPVDVFSMMAFCQEILRQADEKLQKAEKLVQRIEAERYSYGQLKTMYSYLLYHFEVVRNELIRLKFYFVHPKKPPVIKKYRTMWQHFKDYVWKGTCDDLKVKPGEIDPTSRQHTNLVMSRDIYLSYFPEYKDDYETYYNS